MFSHCEISDSRRKYVTQPPSHGPGHPVFCGSLKDLIEHFRIRGLDAVNHALGLPLLSHPTCVTHTHITFPATVFKFF